MSEPSIPGVKHTQDALTYGYMGRPDLAGLELRKIADLGPAALFASLSAFAAVAVSDQMPKPGEFLGLQVEYAGRPASAADAPAGIRLAAQLMTAQANSDSDTAEALFKAALRRDPACIADALRIVFDAAVATVRAQIARSKRDPR